MADNKSRSGWLDEVWTIVLAVPVIMAFVPGAQDAVGRGFHILQYQVPIWYQGAFGAAVAWGFARPRLQIFRR